MRMRYLSKPPVRNYLFISACGASLSRVSSLESRIGCYGSINHNISLVDGARVSNMSVLLLYVSTYVVNSDI